MIAGDPAKQWEWHEAHRDMLKNMYRTSYSDMSHGREVTVKSDFPSGYAGHVRCVGHDILHRNTQYDRVALLSRSDPSRDAFPSFMDQIAGIPTITKFPSGAKKTPSYGVVPHNGTTTMLKPPWGIMTSKRDPLNYRASPPTMKRVQSTPSMRGPLGGAGSLMSGEASPFSPSSERLRKTVQMANDQALSGEMLNESDILGDELGM
ncbi:unnamed protein product [Polarella glacialis]|uniref:Uncharacterized protein n=1 Tax=Polarella glacialis TaxID=89957 RepID=A0A813LJ31_POLGL|nr:unnamed protein product [Polarella glacialis]CAE8647221.1 unnamed protein product [Polarella glacialis]CAE8735275.1 unnamed protein product [Polarella glacialis]|mmetsp:Transcript_32438/g.52193  ORF Transcript_32438/g.52193 Transcript_32438/m.52193 type:complete len:206 (-) Transcript_32438:171-788(-)|eukprot:CAMPEP_0115070016 /NCGR_PEP_ID=MMETSP0227-20121206/12876_1 /TAXON_ID=89957 /ORGANISM="Polarella glacialis, Strain CCMP 1383" /LENGTH=205 /DNA_ID=CAMNT_0002456477 /DNA_START=76 /DNA_END=693 /DNA_ORIENTATION=-